MTEKFNGYVMDMLSEKPTIYIVDDESVFTEGFRLNVAKPSADNNRKIKAYLRKLADAGFKTTNTIPQKGIGIGFAE